jgi:hypothetical protein
MRSFPFPLIATLTLWLATGSGAFGWPGKIELPPFPKDDPAQAFADLKIYGPNGSPLRQPQEDWEGARQRVEKDPGWAQWVAKRRSVVDDWMKRRRDRTDWVAGWTHHFVSPKDGSSLKFIPDEPGEETLSSPTDPKVKLTPKIHASWVYQFRSLHADMMREAAELYRLTGEKRYAEWAAGQLDFYSENREKWELHGGARIFFQSLDEAVVLTKWVNTARILGDFVSPDRKEKWGRDLFKPQAELLEKTFQVIHNISCWHRSAVGHVALYCQDENLWKTAVDAPYGLRAQITKGITSDYLWYEQSLGYNTYVVRAVLPFFEYACLAGRGDELKKEMEMIQNLMLAPLYLRFPNGRLPAPADGSPGWTVSADLLVGRPDPLAASTDGTSFSLATVARVLPTKIGLRLHEAWPEKTWARLLDPLPPGPPAHLPAVVSRNMESSRMALLRQGPWQVYFHYGQLAGTHSQPEALNFEAFYNDIPVTLDPGTPRYGGQLVNGYFRTGAGHNVPLMNGKGQKPGWQEGCWSPGKFESFTESSASASQPDYMEGAQASRSLAIEGDTLVDEVTIKALNSSKETLGFVLNLQGKVRLPEEFSENPDFGKSTSAPGFPHWEQVRSATLKDRAVFDVDFGGTRLRVEFQLPGEFVISHGKVPDFPPGTQREAFYLETTGRKATLRTTFGPP